MRAVVLENYGGPDQLKLDENWPDPHAEAGFVVVRTSAASLNPVDWKLRAGYMKAFWPLDLPAILGVDVAGTVEHVGEGVTGFNPGDAVMAMSQRTYAEQVAVPAKNLARVPAGMNLADAAAIPLVAVTAEIAVREAGAAPGRRILITGALGSVGRIAVFRARELGASVVAGVRAKHLAEATELAGEAVDTANVSAAGKVDAVIDLVGGDLIAQLFPLIRDGGTFVSVLGPPPVAQQFPQVQLRLVASNNDPNPAYVLHVAEAIVAGKLKLPVTHRFPLAQAAEAHRLAEAGGVGKVLLEA